MIGCHYCRLNPASHTVGTVFNRTFACTDCVNTQKVNKGPVSRIFPVSHTGTVVDIAVEVKEA